MAVTISGLSGTMLDAQTVTIYGSGFGSDVSASRMHSLKSNIEGGADEGAVFAGGSALTNWAGDAVYDSAEYHSGTKSIRHTYEGADYSSALNYHSPDTITSFFSSIWRKISTRTSYAAPIKFMLKAVHVSENNHVGSATSLSFETDYYQCKDGYFNTTGGFSITAPSAQASTVEHFYSSFPLNTWVRWENFFKDSSAVATADAVVSLNSYIPGSTIHSLLNSSNRLSNLTGAADRVYVHLSAYWNRFWDLTYFTKDILSITDNGSGRCRIETSAAHGQTSGNIVYVTGCGANHVTSFFRITVIDATHFDTYNPYSVGYLSGGTATTAGGNYNGLYITELTDNGSGKVRVGCGNHGFAEGESITISGCSTYLPENVYTISNVATNTFDVESVSYSAGYSSGGLAGQVNDADIWEDDIWISINNGRARVVITDNSTFSSSTNLEIQYPTAWAADEITITLNQGSFAPGDTAYLFVVDSSGNVSSGYGFTFPSTGRATPYTSQKFYGGKGMKYY